MPTFVTGGNRVVLVIRALSTTNNMTPPSSNLCAWGDTDYRAVLVRKTFVASELSIIDVLYGVVGVWSADPLQLTLVCTVDRDLLHDGVRRHIVYGKECTESNLGDLHAGL